MSWEILYIIPKGEINWWHLYKRVETCICGIFKMEDISVSESHKTAYNADGKITGTIEDYNGEME